MNKHLFLNIFFIVIGSMVLGFTYNTLSPDGIPFFAKETVFEQTSLDEFITSGSDKDQNVAKEVDLKTAFEIHQKNLAVFIDGRDEWEFGAGRIAGAVNMPDYNFEDYIDKYNVMDKRLNYVVYCGGEDCDISIRLAKKLNEIGFTNVYVFPGGWDQWYAANFPVEHD